MENYYVSDILFTIYIYIYIYIYILFYYIVNISEKYDHRPKALHWTSSLRNWRFLDLWREFEHGIIPTGGVSAMRDDS